MRNAGVFAILCASLVAVYLVFVSAVVSPELTARYTTRQQEQTARYLVQQRTEQIQAQEWGATLRTWGTGARDVAVILVIGVAAGTVLVVWQRERTKRHTTSQQALVLIAYRDTFGGRLGTWQGAPVVYLDDSQEIITPATARLELRRARLTVDTE